MLSIYGIFTHSVAHSREACDHVSLRGWNAGEVDGTRAGHGRARPGGWTRVGCGRGGRDTWEAGEVGGMRVGGMRARFGRDMGEVGEVGGLCGLCGDA
jgi:hypothetical protein